MSGFSSLPPRCQWQVGITRHAPYRPVICPRSAVAGTRWCDRHTDVGDAFPAIARDTPVSPFWEKRS